MIKKYVYKTKGTCSRAIFLTVDGDTLLDAMYMGGCSGNTQGICRLIKGQKLSKIRETLSGIRCGEKPTSCPDQLSRAIGLLEEGKLGSDLIELEEEK